MLRVEQQAPRIREAGNVVCTRADLYMILYAIAIMHPDIK